MQSTCLSNDLRIATHTQVIRASETENRLNEYSGRFCFHERLAARIQNLPEEYAPFVPWATETSRRLQHHTASQCLPLRRIDALFSREEAAKERVVSHDETDIILPVATCTAQVLYEGTRDCVKRSGTQSIRHRYAECVWYKQAEGCILIDSGSRLLNSTQAYQSKRSPGWSSSCVRVYALRERTLEPSACLAWMPDLSIS